MVLNVLLGVYGNILKFMIGYRNLLLTSIVTPVNRFVDEQCYNPNNLKQNKLCLRENTSQVMVSLPLRRIHLSFDHGRTNSRNSKH